MQVNWLWMGKKLLELQQYPIHSQAVIYKYKYKYKGATNYD